MKKVLLLNLVGFIFLSMIMSFSGKQISQNNQLCGPSVQLYNEDNNGSDFVVVKLTNVATGQVYTLPNGTTGANIIWGVYDVEVYTDCQGLLKIQTALGFYDCQDAYSWSGDSKLYTFDNIDVRFCGLLRITIDDIEC